jgi:hypothetical protein
MIHAQCPTHGIVAGMNRVLEVAEKIDAQGGFTTNEILLQGALACAGWIRKAVSPYGCGDPECDNGGSELGEYCNPCEARMFAQDAADAMAVRLHKEGVRLPTIYYEESGIEPPEEPSR